MKLSTCDMHMHTTYSDGRLNSIEILNECKRVELDYLSITDHDCVDFYFDKKAIEFAKELKLNILTGCEFCASVGEQGIEILGYGIDVDKAKKYLDKNGITQNKIETYRSLMTPKIFKQNNIQLDYNPANIDFSLSDPGVLPQLLESIRRNEKAVEFVSQENPILLENVSNLLRLGLNNPSSKLCIHVSKCYPDYKKIIDLIHDFGGIAVLAHPFQYGKNTPMVLQTVKDYGIEGIECYHHTSCDNPINRDFLLAYCKNNNLLISGGSDFHASSHINDKLNKFKLPQSIYENILNKIKLRTISTKNAQ